MGGTGGCLGACLGASLGTTAMARAQKGVTIVVPNMA